MESYDTIVEAINGLRRQGYTEDFNLKENCIECREGKYRIFHNEFVIDKFFRFEGESDPSDGAILYAISSDKYKLKGVLVNAYGIYSDTIANEMLEKLNPHPVIEPVTKLLAFAGSNSRNSINKKLVQYALKHMPHRSATLIDLNDFEMPLFSVDREKEQGYPKELYEFLELIKKHDAIVCSLAENNRSYSVAFKNIFDWCSRITKNIFDHKPMLLMSASTGRGGGKNVLNTAGTFFPEFGAEIITTFSLPLFNTNFSEREGVKDPALRTALLEKIKTFL